MARSDPYERRPCRAPLWRLAEHRLRHARPAGFSERSGCAAVGRDRGRASGAGKCGQGADLHAA